MPTTALCNRCHSELKIEDKPAFSFINEWHRTMYIPSDTEVSQIQSFIKDADRDLSRYDEEIERLSETLATLKQHKEDLQICRDRYHAFSAPVRRLPVELLEEVFMWCCRPSLLVNQRSTLGVVAPAHSISQTCSYWREIALKMPTLWSDLQLHLAYEEAGAATKGLVDLYLRNSGSALLTLEVSAYSVEDHSDEAQPGEDSCIWPILQSLFECGNHWTKVSFGFGCNVLCVADDFLSQPTECHYSRLKDFTLSMFEESSLSDIFSSIWQHAPALLSLEIPSCDVDTFVSASPGLQDLLIELPVESPSIVLRLFQSFPALQKMDFEIDSADDSLDDEMLLRSDLPITHIGMRTFSCRFYLVETWAVLFASLTLPSLTTLDLTCFGSGVQQSTIIPGLRDMIQRSGCHLQRLKLSGQLVQSSNELLQLLILVPEVTELDLSFGPTCSALVAGEFFSRLAFTIINHSQRKQPPTQTSFLS